MLDNKYNKLSYGELNQVFIDKLKLKDFYLKSISICPDESFKMFLTKALMDVEREIENIKNINYQIFNEINFISCK